MFDEPEDVEEPPPRHPRPYLAMRGELTGAVDTPDGDAVSRLRPYLITSGRAEPVDHTLEIEAQVLTTELGASAYPRLSFEHRDIVRLSHRRASGLSTFARREPAQEGDPWTRSYPLSHGPADSDRRSP